MLIAQSSAILASYLPTLIINHFGGKDSPGTFLIMAAIFGGLFSSGGAAGRAVHLGAALYRGREADPARAAWTWTKAALIPVNMFRDLFSTLRIKAFCQHLSLYLGGYISQDIFNTAFPLFVGDGDDGAPH